VNRSTREADLLGRIELLDRRCYELVSDSGAFESGLGSGLGLTTSFAVGNPSAVVISQGIDVVSGDDGLVLQGLEGGAVEGCLRTRTYRCVESVRSGTSVGEGPGDQKVPRYLVVHGMAAARSVVIVRDMADISVS
jgi:hypothetical protein